MKRTLEQLKEKEVKNLQVIFGGLDDDPINKEDVEEGHRKR